MDRCRTPDPAHRQRAAMPCAKDRPQDHAQTVGPDGPVLLQDSILHETLNDFVHEKSIERAVHTKGYGAFGYFLTCHSMSPFTTASFLQNPGVVTRTFSRFSLAVSNKGTPDSGRNVHGFSTKFYLPDGAFDLLCNHIPVFLVRDAMRFPAAIHALSPSPVNNLIDPAAFWRFVAETPEAMHFVTWLYSDLGTQTDLPGLRTYGVNTYVWKNAAGQRRYVKYHWLPVAQPAPWLTRDQAEQLAGSPDVSGQKLYDLLAHGQTVAYDLHVQLMDPDGADELPYDVLDDTKVWEEAKWPLRPVGRLVLEKNPDDYNEQVEKAAFSPANLIEGIELSSDKMLQGRSFVYWDAQRRRIGPQFRKVPVNHMAAWQPGRQVTSGTDTYACGTLQRTQGLKSDDFTQAGQRYRALDRTQQAHLVDNVAAELYAVPEPYRSCVQDYFWRADPGMGQALQTRMDAYAAQQ